MSKVLVPAKHVEDRLGVGEVTLWRMRKKGTGPTWCKVGSRVMYDFEAVEAWIAARIAEASALTETAAA